MQQGTRMAGVMHEQHPVRRSPDAFGQAIALGKEGSYWTKLKIYAKAATPQFPEPALFVQMGNGRDTTFARIKPEELQLIADLVKQMQEVSMKLWPQLESHAAALGATLDANAQVFNFQEFNHMDADEQQYHSPIGVYR